MYHISILQKIINLSKEYQHLTLHNISEINKDLININKESHNFFNEYPQIIEEYNMLFGDFMNTNKINELTNFISELETLLQNICEHKYIDDFIDIDPEKSVRIKYCEHCNKTIPL
jgi:hypothetical protein